MGKLLQVIIFSVIALQLNAQANLSFNIKEIKPFPNDVHGIAHNPVDGAMYFTSFYSGSLLKLDYPYTGSYSNTGITGQRPAGLLWHQQSLFMADLMEGKIKQYDASLNLVNTFKVPNPWNMTTDGQSIYVITFSGELYKIHNQQVLLLTTGLGYPFDIAFSPDQTLYISEQNGSNVPGRIVEYDLNGNLLHVLPNLLSTPLGITFNNKGDFFVADNASGCIYCILPDGSSMQVSCSFDKPIAVVPNTSGDILVSTASSGGTLLEVSSNQSTSLNDLGVSNLLLFPNPAAHHLFISLDLEHRATPEVAIYSVSGQNHSILDMKQLQKNGTLEITINTRHLDPGNYLVKIWDEKFRVTRQFSISR